MPGMYKILDHQTLQTDHTGKREFALDVLIGLSKSPKALRSKYFYDDEGSRLFQNIMELPEYYPTQCEFEIFETHHERLSQIFNGDAFNLVELGPGDGVKTKVLLDSFINEGLDFHYNPIDISEAAMRGLVESLKVQYPNVQVKGLVADYFDGVAWLAQQNKRRNFVLFLGANIGNFDYVRCRAFLYSLWNSLNHNDYVLIGFDLKKDVDILLKAYNDSQGVTGQFNLNLLRRINHELGGNFNLKKFQHYGNYNAFNGAMESYLISREQQTVYIEELQQAFEFRAWEAVNTEFSFKYLESEIENLARETSFVIEKQFFDSRHYFVDSLWRVEKFHAEGPMPKA